MCLYPRLIKNKKYISNKKNGGNIPTIQDERTRYVPVGCQNCMECRKQKSREWQARLSEDIKTHTNGTFITLTFSDESIKELTKIIYNENKESNTTIPEGYNLDNAIATKATRLWLERWRKKYGKSIRHWLVTELGHNGTENIHLHGIIWTDKKEEIKDLWQYGYIWLGQYVNQLTVNYIIKYVTKIDEINTLYKSKILTSPGIGHEYTKSGDWKNNKFKETETKETYRTPQGLKIGLPIYWRNKLYTEEEREILWLQKLDKEERWVLGNKIDISKTQNEYEQALKYARRKNTQFGYGSDIIDQETEQYERNRRIIMQQTRIKKAENKNPPGVSCGIQGKYRSTAIEH